MGNTVKTTTNTVPINETILSTENSCNECGNNPIFSEPRAIIDMEPSTENTENNRNEMKVNRYFPEFTKENTKIVLDEISSSHKKEKQEKDEMYKNVALTKEFLQQNIMKESFMEFHTSVSKLLTKDIYGFDILKINLVDYGLKYSKYISSVKINFISKDFDNETINTLLRNSSYNLTFDIYNLIFYGDFIQNQNLLLSNNLENYIVLPQIITKHYNNIDINILNVKKLLPILEKLEIKILVSILEFNEFAEGRINYKYCFEQYYERNDETWNELNICNGSTCVGYSMNMPIKKKENE